MHIYFLKKCLQKDILKIESDSHNIFLDAELLIVGSLYKNEVIKHKNVVTGFVSMHSSLFSACCFRLRCQTGSTVPSGQKEILRVLS